MGKRRGLCNDLDRISVCKEIHEKLHMYTVNLFSQKLPLSVFILRSSNFKAVRKSSLGMFAAASSASFGRCSIAMVSVIGIYNLADNDLHPSIS